MTKRSGRKFNIFLLVAVVAVILGITVFTRQGNFINTAARAPFWSYVDFFNGDFTLGPEIILNVGLFMPFGFILASILNNRKIRWLIVLICGCVFSIIIECTQYFLKIGLAEFDDVFDNTLGAMIGLLLFIVADKIFKDKVCLKLIASAFVLFGCIFVVWETVLIDEGNNSSKFAFQIDKITDGEISGYAFPYEIDAGSIDYAIILKDTETGAETTLLTETGLERNDVDKYYNGESCLSGSEKENTVLKTDDASGSSVAVTEAVEETEELSSVEKDNLDTGAEHLTTGEINDEKNYDYTKSGFVAECSEIPQSVEVLVNWDGVGIKRTGMYIVNGIVQCTEDLPADYSNVSESSSESKETDQSVSEKTDGATVNLQELVDSGTWLAHTSACSCDVYQIGDKLYWVAGPDYNFASDGSTRITYSVYTTNDELLPLNRQQMGFDLLGFNFEDNEITGTLNCGNYRVAVCDIPKSYPISCIVTGYYKQSHWIWEEYLRPVISEIMD